MTNFNKHEINGKVAYIFYNTRKEKNAGFFIIDTKNLNKIKRYKGNNLRWYKNDKGYAIADIRIIENGKPITKHIRMHRLIMDVLKKNVKEVEIDHASGYAKDNRECNLRYCYTDEEKTAHRKNMENRQKLFLFPDIVEIKRDTKMHLFLLKLSNSIFKDVKFYFDDFIKLLETRDFLYDVGLDEGIERLVFNFRENILNKLKTLDENSRMYNLHISQLNYLNGKIEEAKENLTSNEVNEKIKELKDKGIDIPKDTPIFTEDGQVLIISTMTSKEKIQKLKTGEEIPVLQFLPNYQED